VVSAINGLPWWYFHGLTGWPRSPHLRTVDPDGAFWKAVGPEKAIGCVVHLGSNSLVPGEVRHAYGAQLVLGEPAVAPRERSLQVAELLAAGGFKVRVTDDIRAEVWRKLWSNLAINPVSLLTGAACDQISADADAVDLMVRMMDESVRIAHALGMLEPLDSRAQARGFAAIGAFKTSMLQDLEAGRTVEIDPILGALVELAAILSIDVPSLRHVYALARLRAGSAGCYAPIEIPPAKGIT
jgi:2-dehydropantoate 2-reductase